MHLQRLYFKFNKETEWLLDYFNSAIVVINSAGYTRDPLRLNAEMTVVRLHDCWARFCRELIVLSAGARPYTANNLRLNYAPGVFNCQQVIPKLLSTFKNKKYEPKWASSSEAIDAAQRLRISNVATISAALGAVISPIEEIRVVRNFFAHRCHETVKQIKANPTYTRLTATKIEHMAADIAASGIPRMEDWILRLRIVAEAAIQ